MNTKRILRTALFGILTVGALAATAIALIALRDRPETGGLATINGTPITEETFRYWWERSNRSEDNSEARQTLLERLIEREAMVQRAEELGLADDLELREQIRSLLISRLKEVELHPEIAAIEVDEDKLRANYDERFSQAPAPDLWRVAVLWFDTRGIAPLEARYQTRLESVRSAVAERDLPISEGFGPHSHRNSEHLASRYKGGILPPLQGGEANDPWRRAVLDIAGTLERGQVSKPIVTSEGTFLVRLLERVEDAGKTFETERNRLAAEYRRGARAQAEEDFRTGVLADASIKKTAGALDALSNLPTTSQLQANAQ